MKSKMEYSRMKMLKKEAPTKWALIEAARIAYINEDVQKELSNGIVPNKRKWASEYKKQQEELLDLLHEMEELKKYNCKYGISTENIAQVMGYVIQKVENKSLFNRIEEIKNNSMLGMAKKLFHKAAEFLMVFTGIKDEFSTEEEKGFDDERVSQFDHEIACLVQSDMQFNDLLAVGAHNAKDKLSREASMIIQIAEKPNYQVKIFEYGMQTTIIKGDEGYLSTNESLTLGQIH